MPPQLTGSSVAMNQRAVTEEDQYIEQRLTLCLFEQRTFCSHFSEPVEHCYTLYKLFLRQLWIAVYLKQRKNYREKRLLQFTSQDISSSLDTTASHKPIICYWGGNFLN